MKRHSVQDKSYRKRILVKTAYHHLVCHMEKEKEREEKQYYDTEDCAAKEKEIKSLVYGEEYIRKGKWLYEYA